MTYLYQFEIGTTLAGLTNIEALTTKVTPPKSTFSPYADVRKMGNGSYRGVGAAIASWKWGIIKPALRDQLRLFCPEPSVTAVVWIRTYTKEHLGSPQIFQALMHWPVLEEETDAGRAIGLEIKFTEMVVPPAVFAAIVNDNDIAVGATTIAYDGGTIGDDGDITAGQTCLVGTAPGLSNVGHVLTVSASSPNLVVAANSIVWADDQYLTVVS